MNSAELVHRLARLVASGGAGDDGAGLASEYAEKVRALLGRIDAVETAQRKGEYGEAMRLLDERPRLLDEIGVLDFHQFGPWKGLCEEKGWEVPPAVDGSAVERLLAGYDGSAAMEEMLKDYRKAVRKHDAGGQVRALRRLAAGPDGGDWGDALSGAESAWAEELVAAFDAAVVGGDQEAARAAAEELAGSGWRTPPAGDAVSKAQAWLDARAAEERQASLEDCLDRLKALSEGTWDRVRASAEVQQAQYLLGRGAVADPQGQKLLADAAARCEREEREAAAEEKRRQFTESLEAAIRAGDAAGAETLLSTAELPELGVDEELVREGRQVVENAELARRRRVRLWAGAATLLLVAAMAATAYVYNANQLEKRCAAACTALRAAAAGERPWAVLAAQLKRLEETDPKVHAMEAIRPFEAELKRIEAGREGRRAEAEGKLSELADLDAAGWAGADDVTAAALFAAARAPLDEDMAAERERADTLELRWNESREAHRQALAAEAREALPAIEAGKAALAKRLENAYLTPALDAAADEWLQKARQWRGRYGAVAAAGDAQVEGWMQEAEAARKLSGDARRALERLQAATGAVETVEAREALRRHYRPFPGVEAMGDLPVGVQQVADALRGALPEQANVRKLRLVMSEAEFRSFLSERVWPVEDVPELSQLYGIDSGDRVVAVSVGKPWMSPPGSGVATAKGELFDFASGEMARELDFRTTATRPCVLLSPCGELREVVNESRAPQMTQARFISLLFDRVAWHAKAAKGPAVPPFGSYDYRGVESHKSPLQAGRYPAYKRVQTVALYFEWLDQLGALPLPGDPLRRTVDECRRLAEPIVLGRNVNAAISWANLDNARVAARNKECADFLAGIDADFSRNCEKALSERAQLQQVGYWDISFAGKMGFNPESPKSPGWNLLPGVGADHPLYVMRAEGPHVVFRPMLWPLRSGKWGLKGADWLPGEPLFQFKILGKHEYAQERLKAILQRVSPEARRHFEKCGYLLEVPQ